MRSEGSTTSTTGPAGASRVTCAAAGTNKAECFCFTSQSFQPHEELTLKLAFMVATELPAHVDTVSLSYTYFTAPN
jgi:cytochrome c oxidase assembly protein Cox11